MNLRDLNALDIQRQELQNPRIYAPPGANIPLYRRGVTRAQQDVFGVLLHELAHTQQVARLQQMAQLGERSTLPVEGGADAFARLALPDVARALGQRQVAPYAPGYGALWQQYVERYGRPQALYGQFGRQAPG
jgi:hypothetical protein